MNFTNDEMDEYDLLSTSCEDIIPLWEAQWELQNRPRAIRALLSLHAKGWITFWYSATWINRNEVELSEIETESFLSNIDRDEYWVPDEADTIGFYGFGSTEAGDNSYNHDEKIGVYMRDFWNQRRKAAQQQ